MKLTILICTHNRERLLARVLASLQATARPQGWTARVLVVANACNDGTHALLDAERQAGLSDPSRLPVDWLAEPRPGKSNALNTAIPHLMDSDVVAFVDDDHRVDGEYPARICLAAADYPEATLFCGRIVADWDGTEPAWVHDQGPYRIYPAPVQEQEFGPLPRLVRIDDAELPGGGNLFLRPPVFDRIGGFSTDLGPKGHDLGGGEDIAFVLKALEHGERLQYVPEVFQYHYVDSTRLGFPYLLEKAYQRSRSSARVHHEGRRGGVPAYMWRKLAGYGLRAVLPPSWPRLRFYLMRLASTLGEIRGLSDAAATTPRRPRKRLAWPAVFAASGLGGLAALQAAAPAAAFQSGIAATLGVAVAFAATLGTSSLLYFSRTGPQIRKEVLSRYRWYALYAFGRLMLFALLILVIQAAAGSLAYAAVAFLSGGTFGAGWATLASAAGIVSISALQFCRHLLWLPASLVASLNYRANRLYPLWRKLTPGRLNLAAAALIVPGAGLTAASLMKAGADGDVAALAAVLAFTGAALALHQWLRTPDYPRAAKAKPRSGRRNVLMIGSDTLRADRISPELTPALHGLAARGAQLTRCYIPCARTASSLVSMLTSSWPSRHGIRDNFAADAEAKLPMEALPAILGRHGYATAALSDWCGADMGKFSFGFDYVDLPEDQWNLKLFIRQGPKDLRLFLSMFTHNAFGKDFLPEIHYLGWVPMTDLIGREACRLINDLGQRDQPFMLDVFLSTTHAPFGSEYPYYTLFSSREYDGDSKFVMSGLTDPMEIIRRQGESREAFDLDQILALYDGCARRFNDEVDRILRHLEASGLADSTLVVIYSDHGMEFFEQDTWGQGNSALEEHSAQVPIILAGPQIASAGRLDGVTRSVDIMPTLLDLLDLPASPDADGVSLAGALQGGPMPELMARYETGIWLTDLPGMPPGHLRYPDLLDLLDIPDLTSGTMAIKREYQDRVVLAKDRMLRSGCWKLVYQPLVDGAIWRLFDVEADPNCRRDVQSAQPEIFARLKGAMLDWLAEESVAGGAKSMEHDRTSQPA
jgi:arylsulfatase A-like enzyme/GT2 family glycosyltransferase